MVQEPSISALKRATDIITELLMDAEDIGKYPLSVSFNFGIEIAVFFPEWAAAYLRAQRYGNEENLNRDIIEDRLVGQVPAESFFAVK